MRGLEYLMIKCEEDRSLKVVEEEGNSVSGFSFVFDLFLRVLQSGGVDGSLVEATDTHLNTDIRVRG